MARGSTQEHPLFRRVECELCIGTGWAHDKPYKRETQPDRHFPADTKQTLAETKRIIREGF